MSRDQETRLPAGLPGAGPRQAMSLPHNIRPEQMVGPETPGTRWKRFQPLKKLQRMFRRKSKTKEEEEEFPDAPKSFSASQLPPAGRRRSSRRDSPPLQSRLSMSHDSIFQSESGAQQGPAEMGSALSIPSVPGASSQLAAELRGVLLKRRADDSDDDPGLPHSPASPSSPPAASRHQAELKGQSGKSGGSCSDGSLLSMYSSGTCTDDDIFGPLSKHPSRASLGRDPDGLDLETAAALSHSAAKHRIAVRPRRNHGVPRQRRPRARPQTGPAAPGLPPTLEEESPPATPAAPTRPATSPVPAISETPRRAPSASPSRSQSIRTGSPDGATSAASPGRPSQVKRSKSSVADGRIRDVSPRKFWGRDSPAAGATESEDRRVEKGETFFSRLFGSRRSGRKRKEDRSLSPETVTESVPVPARRPPVPRHRSQFAGSPASALHADIIRPPPSEATRAAGMTEPQPGEFSRAAETYRAAELPETHRAAESARFSEQPRSSDIPRGAEIPRSVDLLRSAEAPRSADFPRSLDPIRPASELPRPSEVPRPPLDALRRGPAFLADVRAEVAALAGGDRGDDSVTVSPQVVRRHRVSAAAAVGRPAESPRVRPRLVGLTAYQQRVTHLQRSPSPERGVAAESTRRSFSCENVSEETASRPCSGMALGSVLSLIKSTAAERQQSVPGDSTEARTGGQEPGISVPARPGRREGSGSPGAGPKSLDSSLLSGAVTEPPPVKASSAESVQSGQERPVRNSADQALPEFLRVQLHKVETRQRDSNPPTSPGSSAAPPRPTVPLRPPSGDPRPSPPQHRDSSERDTAPSPAVSDDSPPQLRRPVPAPRSVSPDLCRRPSQARSRGSTSSGDEPVQLRAKPVSSAEDSELLKVFKRRSLKSRDSEELSTAVAGELGSMASSGSQSRGGDGTQSRAGDVTQKPCRGGDEKENEQPREETEETVVCVSVPARGESGEGDSGRRVSVGRRDSEAARRPSAQEEEGSRPPGWLKQAVRERREQREQREQKHLRNPTQKELLIESESSAVSRQTGPSRSSRVLEMANTFQKLQTT